MNLERLLLREHERRMQQPARELLKPGPGAASKRPDAPLPEKVVEEMTKDYESGQSFRSIAEKYNVLPARAQRSVRKYQRRRSASRQR